MATATAPTETSYDVQMIPIDQIAESPMNPRKTFTDMEELVADVAQRGILQPVLVRPGLDAGYELVFGARRFRAAKAAGLASVPAMVRALVDAEALELMIVENCKRADIHPLEEAEGYRELHQRHGHDVDDIAGKVGKSRAFVYGRMKLCALTPPARKAFLEGKLSPSVALLVARVPPKLQAEATRAVTHKYGDELETPLSFREASDVIQAHFMLRLSEAPFPRNDEQLVPAAGTCTACPKRTGNQRELFEDVKSADVCTDPPCFRSKLDAYWERLKETAVETGHRVLSDSETKKVFPSNYGGMSYRSGYVDLADACHAVPYGSKLMGKPYRQVLKAPLQACELTVTVARDQRGQIHKLLPEKDALAALRKLGLTKSTTPSSASTSSHAAKEKARQRKATIRKKTVRAVIERSMNALAEVPPAVDVGAPFWRLVAFLAVDAVSSEAHDRVLERRELPGYRPWEHGSRGAQKLRDALEALKLEEARAVVLELLLEDRAGMMGAWSTEYPNAVAAAAKHFGLDLKGIEREIAKAEPKPKTAAAKGRKK